MSDRIRDYENTDEHSWLRCRVLAFLGTSYYDDVHIRKPELLPGSLSVVAVDGRGEVCGLLDVEPQGDDLFTVDCVAVHPDHQRRGLGDQLLRAALSRLPPRGLLDAWTREDVPATRWYARQGFSVQYQYLHVHITDDGAAALQAPPGFSPKAAFLHASLESEAAARALSERVYRCSRFVKNLTT